MQVAEGKSLLLQSASYSGRIKLADDVTVTSNSTGGAAQLSGGAKLESLEGGKASITGVEGSSLANASIALSEGTSLKIDKLTMTGQAAITGADGSRIDNSLIHLAAGTRLEMANVILGTGSRITDDPAVLVANGLVVEADILSYLEPLTYGDAVPNQVEEPADMVCLTLSNIQDVLIEGEGTGLVVRMVGGSSQMLDGKEWLRLGLGEGEPTGSFSDNLAVTLEYTDAAGKQRSAQGVYTWEDVEEQAAVEAAAQNHHYVYFRLTGTVPEPTTSALSLLALAALASRRRRKA